LINETLFESLKKNIKRIKVDELLGADNQPKKVKKGKVKNTTIGAKSFKKLKDCFQ
jgi:hypothetical protein